MPTNFTPNYNLNQWEPEDRVLRTDFNADNAKLDAAIKAVDGKAGSKADQSALDAESAAREAADDALNAALAVHTTQLSRRGNCQIETFSYTGTGGSGSVRTVINFPRVPVFALILDGYGCFILTFPGLTSGYYRGDSNPVHFQWNGSSLSMNSSSEQYQMNAKGSVYQVIAFYAQDAG